MFLFLFQKMLMRSKIYKRMIHDRFIEVTQYEIVWLEKKVLLSILRVNNRIDYKEHN